VCNRCPFSGKAPIDRCSAPPTPLSSVRVALPLSNPRTRPQSYPTARTSYLRCPYSPLVCCSTFTRSYFKLAVHSCSFIHPPALFLVFLSPHHHSICVHHACGSLTPIALCPILSGSAVNNLILTLPILLLSYSYLPLSPSLIPVFISISIFAGETRTSVSAGN
jgi:hypothetical protein